MLFIAASPRTSPTQTASSNSLPRIRVDRANWEYPRKNTYQTINKDWSRLAEQIRLFYLCDWVLCLSVRHYLSSLLEQQWYCLTLRTYLNVVYSEMTAGRQHTAAVLEVPLGQLCTHPVEETRSRHNLNSPEPPSNHASSCTMNAFSLEIICFICLQPSEIIPCGWVPVGRGVLRNFLVLIFL